MKKLLMILSMLTISAISLAKETSKVGSEITLTHDNLIVLRTDFNQMSVGEVIARAHELDSKLPSGYPIYLFLYTPGGSIDAGLQMFEALKGINRPVHTVTLFAASMGFQTVQQLGKRYIVKYGTLMSHKARGGFSGEFGDGASQLDARYGQWLRRIEILDNDTVARTKGKQTLKSYRAAYASELWLNGEEAVKQGYADEVVTLKCDSELNKTTTSQTFDIMGFEIEAVFSGCPLITNPKSMKVNVETTEGKMSVEQFVQRNGKFGESCGTKVDNGFSYSLDNSTSKPELCLINKKITLEELYKAKNEKQMSLTKDLKNSVQYSY